MLNSIIIWLLGGWYGARMKVYGPGDYVIRPADYGYASHIIVEMWSAGGSTLVYGQCDASAGMPGTCSGAGSGGYIKSAVTTRYGSFTAHVGASLMSNASCDGGASWLRKNDMNLTIEGGHGRCVRCNATGNCGSGGRILSTSGVSDTIIHCGTDGISICAYMGGSLCVPGWQGGDAPHGGNGGHFSWGVTGGYQPNGTSPGGGGGCCGNGNPRAGGWGGDGTLVIYW